MLSRLRTCRRPRTRRAPDQQPGRRVPARVTGTAVAGPAGPVQPESPDEGREVREMGGGDLGGGRQMLQTVRQNVPRRVTPEDLSDPSLLRAREHGRVTLAERQPWITPRRRMGARRVQSRPCRDPQSSAATAQP